MNSHIIKGSVERLVLDYLATHQTQLIKPISRALEKDYKSMYNAVVNLERKGFVEKGRSVVTNKHAEYSGYRLTEKGVDYALAYGQVDVDVVLAEYEEDLKVAKIYGKVKEIIRAPATRRKFVKSVARFKLFTGEGTSQNPALIHLAVFASSLFNEFSPSEVDEIKSAFVKNKKALKSLKRLMAEFGLKVSV